MPGTVARAGRDTGLSATEARRMALRAQGLGGGPRRPRTPASVLDVVAALQLDTISVLARSHELVCLARCGPLPRTAIDGACWGRNPDGSARSFEYWAHAASILPAGLWPWFAFRRRSYRQRAHWGHQADPAVAAEVLARLADGPRTATELGGAKAGGEWWSWSPVKVALEVLLARGEVVCTTRRAWRRVYELTGSALPAALTGSEPDDPSCLRHLVGLAGAALGVGTVADLADYWRLRSAQVAAVVADTGLVAVAVEGWSGTAWADPAALGALGSRGRHPPTLLSPFDSLIWDRARTQRVFGFHHRLEAYVPAARRVHGYYAMPVLAAGRIVGRVDPVRRGRTLVARRVGLASPAAVDPTAAALADAARWVDASVLAVEVVDPPALGPALQAAVAAAG